MAIDTYRYIKSGVLGIDLATRRYRDVGIAILQEVDGEINCQFLRPSAIPALERGDQEEMQARLQDPPTVAALTDYICGVATQHNISVIAIDGPQAWKSPDNGLEHQRLSEKALRTQAKTGLPESCKPATSLRFVRFAIQLYAALEARGWPRQMSAVATSEKCVIEVFPTAAWRAQGLKPLPSKAASSPETVLQGLQTLSEGFPLRLQTTPNHDELQALMAGLVGLAFARQQGYRSLGVPPFLLDKTWREGFIVNFEEV